MCDIAWLASWWHCPVVWWLFHFSTTNSISDAVPNKLIDIRQFKQALQILPPFSLLSLIICPFFWSTLSLKNDLRVQVNCKHFLKHVSCVFALFCCVDSKIFYCLGTNINFTNFWSEMPDYLCKLMQNKSTFQIHIVWMWLSLKLIGWTYDLKSYDSGRS